MGIFSNSCAEDVLSEFWRPYAISNRVTTAWGTHSLVEATRNLLWEAFRDPSNQRFVLVSEADIPLWDPFVRKTAILTYLCTQHRNLNLRASFS